MSIEQAVKINSDHVRDVADHYPTPIEFCRAALDNLPFAINPQEILDPGAGLGPWGEVAHERWPKATLTGIEIRPEVPHNKAYWIWFQGSFIHIPVPKEPKGPFKSEKQEKNAWERYAWRLWASQQPRFEAPVDFEGDLITPDLVQYDLILGNPPYADGEEFVEEAMKNLREGGVLAYLLRLAFCEGQDRSKGLWTKYPPHTVAVAAKRPSFTGNGKTDATAYAMYYFIKGYKGPTFLSRIDWDY